ncbi:nucleotidyl transferase AbiEii/AbiGii toxin family protein [Arcanobacterium pinnipediorum]|uniref:Nucleotidyl transferase AbiEii/AbiGii toxin family protein n=1 Tax=Arcanobacterium pinnipediorum TaxID=1503041 RepID=A0ABY5AG99_9ACTO|nr:nucleotidyl transferase AbiEii/AbiGii toxin family protein [Arcanobacterium pinnipediorum]USR79011.1 nucleotidyl transferase AbiEii/AbiGii toxin family protein [Arcanobacterium pinnipediorum]
MTERRYRTARALELAVKESAKKSSQNTNHALEGYYTGRFLERIFSEDPPAFILKGGRGMLARTIDARYTRDTDVVYNGHDLEEAVDELKRIARIDLGDYLEYTVEPDPQLIASNQEYRDGYRVKISVLFGKTKKLNAITLDLVVDRIAIEETDAIEPANRLSVEGIPVFTYRVYPVVNAIADKVCATMQRYEGGRASSRVRDLVDLIIYMRNEDIDGDALSKQLASEARIRRLGTLDSFHVPEDWLSKYSDGFRRIAKEAKLPVELQDIMSAEELVKTCIDPALAGETGGAVWDSRNLRWEKRRQEQ